MTVIPPPTRPMMICEVAPVVGPEAEGSTLVSVEPGVSVVVAPGLARLVTVVLVGGGAGIEN